MWCDVHHILCSLMFSAYVWWHSDGCQELWGWETEGTVFGIFRFHMPNAKSWQEELTNIHLFHFNIYGRMSLTYNPEPLKRFNSFSITIQTYTIATAFCAHLCLFATLVFPGRQYFWHHHHFLWQYHRGFLKPSFISTICAEKDITLPESLQL